MPKPRYTPPSDEIAAQIAEVVELHRLKQEYEAKYKAALIKVTDPEGAAVPIAYLASQLGLERKTVYRHTGRSMT